MISYSAIVSPLVFLSIGSLADIILEKLKQLLKEMKNSYALLSNFLLVLISLLFLNTSRIENNHTMKKPLDNFNRELSLRQQNKIQKLAAEIPDSSYVIFNCDKFLNIPIMFFTGHIAYDFLPGEDQLLNLRNEGYKIAVMNADSLPSYIRRSDALILKY